MKVLFFAPHSAIWLHAFPEALVAEALIQRGHEVTYVGCGGALKAYCQPMEAMGVATDADDKKKEAICRVCRRNDGLLRREFAFEGPTLAQLIEPGDAATVERMIADDSAERLIALECDGIQIGRLALYNFLLRTKKSTNDFSAGELIEYKEELRSTLYAWLGGQRILATAKPDRVIVYNSLYAVNRVVCKLAEKAGIPYYFMHAGMNLSNRMQTLMIGKSDYFNYARRNIELWSLYADLPAKPDELRLVTAHYRELLNGTSVFAYSDPMKEQTVSIRQRFRVPDASRLLVATLSSYDELRAAAMAGIERLKQPCLFPTQAEWVRALIAFVRERSDLFLIIRVHPREFPNKREGVRSQHAVVLEQELRDLPANVAVNWPSQNLSLYAFADGTDVFLNAWSSVGKEMSLLGLPVLIYAPELVSYPPDLNYVGTTLADYHHAIEQALTDGWSFERARRAFRWSALEYAHSSFYIGDSFPKPELPSVLPRPRPSLPRRIVNEVRSRLERHADDSQLRHKADCDRRMQRLGVADEVARLLEDEQVSPLDLLDTDDFGTTNVAEETLVLRAELAVLAEMLFPSPASRSNSRLYRMLMAVAESQSRAEMRG